MKRTRWHPFHDRAMTKGRLRAPGAIIGISSAGVDEAVKRTAVKAYAARAGKHQARESALATEPVECIETDS